MFLHAATASTFPVRMLLKGSSKWSRSRAFTSAARLKSHDTKASTSELQIAPKQQPRAAYIHLPFCKRKCHYCDFPVHAVGRNPASQHVQQQMQQYVDMLCTEIRASDAQGQIPMDTVYFGGGTPSLVPAPLVQQILHTLHDKFGIHPQAEVSIEADPGTFDVASLSEYKRLGITRVSMGVQSFQQELLDACGRSHNLEEVYQAIDAVRACGVGSWSLDLISGLPNLQLSSWRHSLQEAIRAGPDHISVYDLQVEEGTPFSRWYEQGRLSFPEDEAAADMYSEAVTMLTSAGYEHYEVSNYAKPGHRSRHNQAYWLGVPYYAFGVGAASYLDGHRFTRPRKIPDYFSWVQALATNQSPALPAGTRPVKDSQEDAMLDTIMLRLRTADGLDVPLFAQQYGEVAAGIVCKALEPYQQRGLVLRLPRLASDQQQHAATSASMHDPTAASSDTAAWDFRLRLSDPEGFLLSNDIISSVFAACSL